MTKRQEQQSGWNVTLTVEVDGQSTSYPVGAALLRDIISSFPDVEASAPLFEIMARHPSSGVRQNVARMEFLSEEAVSILSRDDDISVMQSLCGNDKFKRYATEDVVVPLIARDRDCAESIAGYVERFQNCDTHVLIKAFLDCPDPDRRLALARNSDLSPRLWKEMRNDPDPSVANEAQLRLTAATDVLETHVFEHLRISYRKFCSITACS
jgi:hypothetical protein